ncbi:MAG: PASTA domain-containing protein [Bacteroidales bacterium]|jgi:beta-lactam-binding protein with PASTA domain|nr:PASTA domain-containing protein [Bacteroidales bacterium]
MSKIVDFFRPRRLGFHLVLAFLVTIGLIFAGTLFLRIYTHHGQEYALPDFAGQKAEDLLQNDTNLFIFEVNEYVYDFRNESGVVLKQSPLAGEMVKAGRKVYLTVSSKEPPMLKMPELRDVSHQQAEIMLKAIGLEVGTVIYKPSPYEGVVLDQLYRGRAIGANTEIKYGEKITLVVGRDMGVDSPEPATSDEPPVNPDPEQF